MNRAVESLEPKSRPQSARSGEFFWAAWAVLAAFGCYFCMYLFRKPFTAGSYRGSDVGGVPFKTVLVVAQVLGYMLSKFVGIKVIAEVPPRRRVRTILWLILTAEVALVLFGLTPRPWNALCLFLNGLPLGMVFGLILGCLEGRRLTEALTASLCASFIVADGVAKSIGATLLARGVSEDWMPGLAGGLFLLPVAAFAAMLARIPPPSPLDLAARAQRSTMSRADRGSFFRRYALGLVPIIVVYLIATILRSIRADFAPEIWQALGRTAEPSAFTHSELIVALGVLVVNGCAVLIRDNHRAFNVSLATCGLGFGLLALTLLARQAQLIDSFAFMVLVGLGFYLPYVAIHTTVFERLLAMTRERGNIGFLMYVADAIGYLGYVAVMLARNLGRPSDDLLELLTTACWLAVGLSTLCLLFCWRYFSAMNSSTELSPPVRDFS